MAYSPIYRTLRDGSLVIRDGTPSTPKECEVVCDDGNFTWTKRNEIREQMCRGVIQGTRFGNEQAMQLKCTFKWQQLIQYTVVSTDPIVPYEIIMNEDDSFVSTDDQHEYALEWEFTVIDPNDVGTTAEQITFEIVVLEELAPAEQDEYNKIDFTGRAYGDKPTITRIANP